MGAHEFHWRNLPPDLLAVIASSLDDSGDASAGNDGDGHSSDPALDPAAAIAEAFGPVPTDELVRRAWPQIRDQWVLPDEQQITYLTVALRAAGAARRTHEAYPEPRDFLIHVRNTVRLRAAVIGWLLEMGTFQAAGDVGDGRTSDAGARLDGDDPTGSSTSTASVEPARSSAASGSQQTQVPIDSETIRAMANGELAPQSDAEIESQVRRIGLEWTAFAADLFDKAQGLLPGESVAVVDVGDLQDSGGEWARCIWIRRVNEDTVGAELTRASMVSAAGAYSERQLALLAEMGWKPVGVRLAAAAPAEDGLDDIVGLVVQTLREVYLIARPAALEMKFDGIDPTAPMPAPPAPRDAIFVDNSARATKLIQAILRAGGAYVAPTPDPLTFQARIGARLLWVHIGETEAVVDLAIVVTDQLPGPPEAPWLAPFLLELSTDWLHWSRPVVYGSQLLLAARVPIAATTRYGVSEVVWGLVEESEGTLGAVTPLLAWTGDGGEMPGSPGTDFEFGAGDGTETPGNPHGGGATEGGYL